MNLQLPGGESKVLVGNVAAWALSFHVLGAKTKLDDPGSPAKPFSLSSERYNAKIEATLPGHLEGGSYTFTVEGLTDDDYARIAQRPDKTQPNVVKLYLFWQESNLGLKSYVKNLAGLTDFMGPTPTNEDFLVAVLWIKKVSRKAGARRYETTIEAQELVFHGLSTAIVSKLEVPQELKQAADKVAELANVSVMAKAIEGMKPALAPETPPVTTGAPTDGTTVTNAEAKGNDKRTYPPKKLYGEAMIDIANSARQLSRKGGRGMLLIRDGVLYVGPRPIPFSTDPAKPGKAKELTVASGLVADPTLKEKVPKDATFSEEGVGADAAGKGGDAGGKGADAGAKGADAGAKGGDAGGKGGADDDASGSRRQFEVILKGRPDIKPGDVVKVDVPGPDQAKVKSFGASLADATLANFKGPFLPDIGGVSKDAISLYVSSVKHQLGAATGFVTTLNGVEFKPDGGSVKDDAWDKVAQTGEADKQDKKTSRDGSADPAVDAAKSIKQAALQAVANNRTVEVAEVRSVTKRGDKDAEPPAQTETLWRGLGLGDGRRGQARRLPIERLVPDIVEGIAYTTPFAWGNCGLILPRYPGTRVVVAHRNGDYTDPIEMGAIWQSGHAPQEGELGDWWLILPVDASEQQPPDDKSPPEHTGKASNDLIDAAGNRVIEVGEFTVRVGRSSLSEAGKRPKRAEAADSITIEHADGKARIVIDKDGGILLDAGNSDITMKANNVKVQVKGTMDVSGG